MAAPEASEHGAATFAFVTASVPYSVGDEVFVQDELTQMLEHLPGFVVVPAVLRQSAPNEASIRSQLALLSKGERLFSGAVARGSIRTLVTYPARSGLAVLRALVGSGSLRNLAVNVAIVPKALWLADLVKSHRIVHLHAYWLSHTSTAAMIAAQITGVSWSASAFRWDVAAANALRRKLRTASFIRVADSLAWGELDVARRQVADPCPLVLIRTGVEMAAVERGVSARPVSSHELCCPALFVPKKGHDVLFRAVQALIPQHEGLRLHLFGDGPLRSQIERQISDLELGDRVVMHGTVPVAELRQFMREVRPICVLPSVRAADGQVEGLPTALVEAMACGAPVVSTRSGSIAELVVDGCGLLVEPGDVRALASAIEDLLDDGRLAEQLAQAARRRVSGEFDISRTSARLVECCARAVSGDGHSSGDEQRKDTLSASYRSLENPEYAERWSAENRGNRAIVDELGAAIDDLTARWRAGRDAITLLDVGCGHSSLVGPHLEVLAAGRGRRVGVDLLFERLVASRRGGPTTPLVCADGAALPLPDESVDLVAMFTMMSSVLDPAVRSRIAAEVERVLRPGGAVLWYDMRMPNPRNEHTVALGRRDVAKLFAPLVPTWHSLTVLPPLARRLGPATDRIYPLLTRVRPLHSHLLGLLVKP